MKLMNHALVLGLGYALLALLLAANAPGQEQVPAPQEHSLLKVVDGDTLHVRRAGKLEKLRLLCVDTEETTRTHAAGKPSTPFGDQTSAAVKALLACGPDGMPRDADHPARIRLEFENGREERGNFGRLLCYAYLGEQNLNLWLVENGYSPYFTKYGYSRLHHEAFLRAERTARERRCGIWNPERPDAGLARDYDDQRRWWDLRADALAAFRERRRAGEPLLEAREADLAQHDGKLVTVFGAASRLSVGRSELRLDLEGGVPLAAVLPVEALRDPLLSALARRCREGSANFLYARGKLKKSGRGWELLLSSAEGFAFDAPPPGD